jgi:hypothetical protein
MSTATRGLVAGLIATVALALLILLELQVDLLPDLNIVQLIAAAAGELFGVPETPAAGWTLLFVIGGAWGLVFGWVHNRLPGRTGLVRGLVFATSVWVVMMIVFMPIAGAGWFGLGRAAMAPIVALVMHLIFGAVMGVCFAALQKHHALTEESRIP